MPNLVLLKYGSDGTDPYQVRFYNRAGYLDYLLDVTAVILAYGSAAFVRQRRTRPSSRNGFAVVAWTRTAG